MNIQLFTFITSKRLFIGRKFIIILCAKYGNKLVIIKTKMLLNRGHTMFKNKHT